jgi:tetratricopeptide (TPR) repeat protein
MLSSSFVMETQLYSKIEQLFPDSEEAQLERARWFRSRNNIDEARKVVASMTGEAAAVARLEYGLPERTIPEALQLVAEYPQSIAVYDVALEVLAKVGSWERFEELAEKCRADGLQPRRRWFWDVLVLVLHGETSNAADLLRNHGPAQSGYSGAINLGILELAANRTNQATDAFMIAVGLARNSHDKAAAYIKAGDAMQISRLPEKAASAYEAALGADPASRVARSRLMRLKIFN